MSYDPDADTSDEVTDAETEALLNDFLERNGHRVTDASWVEDRQKYQCPECGALHSMRRDECTVCGWQPASPQSTTPE